MSTAFFQKSINYVVQNFESNGNLIPEFEYKMEERNISDTYGAYWEVYTYSGSNKNLRPMVKLVFYDII